MRAVQRVLDEDPDLRARLEALEGSDREIRESYPADWMARQVARRSERRGAVAYIAVRSAFGIGRGGVARRCFFDLFAGS